MELTKTEINEKTKLELDELFGMEIYTSDPKTPYEPKTFIIVDLNPHYISLLEQPQSPEEDVVVHYTPRVLYDTWDVRKEGSRTEDADSIEFLEELMMECQEGAEILAKRKSKDGCGYHVNYNVREKSYYISDWYNCDSTVSSWSNGMRI